MRFPFLGRNRDEEEIEDDETIDAGPVTFAQNSLDPRAVVGENAIGQLEAASMAAGQRKPQPPCGDAVRDLVGLTNEVAADYYDLSRRALDDLGAQFRAIRDSSEQPIEGTNAPRLDRLRESATAILKQRAARQVKAASRINELAAKIRILTIGIVGDPGREVKSLRALLALILIPFATVALILEFMLNFDVVRFASDRMVSTAFSVAVSIFGILFAHLAATGYRVWATNRDAKAAFLDRFGPGRMAIDQETGQRVNVLPIDAKQRRLSTIGHVGLFALVSSVLLFRLYVIGTQDDPNLGSIAGTLAFAFTVFGLYAFELSMPGIEHPRLKELLSMKEEMNDLQGEMSDLESGADEFREELDGLVAEYQRDAEAGADQSRAKAEQGRAIRDDFLARYAELQGANPWFRDLAGQQLDVFFKWVGISHPDLREDPAYQPSPENIRAIVEGNLQLEDVPDYADIVNYEPQAADSTAAAGVSSQSLFDEIWSSVIGSAEARVRKPDAPVVAGIPHPRIRLAGVSRR